MFALLGVMCVLFGHVSIDGQDAMERAGKLLLRLGYGPQAELASLFQANQETAKHWSVTYEYHGRRVRVLLDADTGRPVEIRDIDPDQAKVLPDGEATQDSTRRAWSALRVLGYDQDVAIFRSHVFRSGRDRVEVDRTVHGLRFFNIDPSYRHRLSFDARTGVVDDFTASAEPLPPVNAWAPRISASAAMLKIADWEVARKKRHGQPIFHDPNDITPELGYFKFKDRDKARLVWRGDPYRDSRGYRLWDEPYPIFVDALSGEILIPDDPSSGYYP